MVAGGMAMHLLLALPRPLSLRSRLAWYVPAATGPVGATAPPVPITVRVVPKPLAPTQSEPSAASAARGAPVLLAFPHWVTPRNTPDGVAADRVTVTWTWPPSLRPELGE